eukprot:1864510-Amphidinium_carterae.1
MILQAQSPNKGGDSGLRRASVPRLSVSTSLGASSCISASSCPAPPGAETEAGDVGGVSITQNASAAPSK